MTDDLTQYLVVHTDDEVNNHDLFVTAKDVGGALDLWKKYYDFGYSSYGVDRARPGLRIPSSRYHRRLPADHPWPALVP